MLLEFDMGTNFYIGNKHIGKRSAAGLYCWDCGLTLCKDGEKEIHNSTSLTTSFGQDISKWHTCCPKCGQKPKDEGWNGALGRELGFNETKPKKKTGVGSCSSFTWAIDSKEFAAIRWRFIKDEYGKFYTKKQFKEVLNECPVQFYNMIGEGFS